MTTLSTSTSRMGLGLGSRLSFMMFLQYAIWGAWLPILYPFLMGYREFSLDQTGSCLAAGAVGAIFGPFIAGQLADRLISTEKLLGISHLIGAGLIYWLGQIDTGVVEETYKQFLWISFIYGFVYAPTLALTNSLAFHHMPDRDRDFGIVRLWGTLGWIIAGIAVGQYLYRFATPDTGTIQEITNAQNAGRIFAFNLSAILGLIMGVYCFTLPHTPPTRNSAGKLAFLKSVREIRMQPLATLFLIAIPVSMVHQFYFVYTSDFATNIQNLALGDDVDAFQKSITEFFGLGGGGIMTIGQMSEIIVLAMMPFLAKRFSRKTLLSVGLLAYAARMALFAYFPTLVPVLIGIVLHGICFGCFIFVAFMIVDERCTKDVKATAQNLFNLVIVGVGIIIGSKFATSLVGTWATGENGIDFQQLFSVPMYMAIGCLLLLLAFYPSKAEIEPQGPSVSS